MKKTTPAKIFFNRNVSLIPIAMLYFRTSVAKKIVFFVDYYPLSNFPHGGKVLLLPPWGKVGKGVKNPEEIKNKFYISITRILKRYIPIGTLRLMVFFLSCFFSYNAYSQTYCFVPSPPVLSLVSVEPESGKVELSWTLSSSSDVAAYIIYTSENGDATAKDTLWNSSLTSYNYISTAYKYFSTSFVVAAYRLPGTPGISRRFGCPSELSNVLSTIFANATIDTCNKKIAISWNSYSSFPKKVTSYSLLVSINGNSFTEAGTIGSDKNSFTLSDFITNSEYCFVVRANLEDGTFSTSNKTTCLSTRMQRPPVWINADQVTVTNENRIALSYTIDPLSEISHFRLERRSGTSGIFKSIALPVSVNGKVKFTDVQANTDTVYYYRLSAINNCNNPVMVSELASNIVLSLEKSGNNLNFSWNLFKKISGNLLSGKMFINTGNGFEEKSSISPGDTTFTIDYKQIMYEITDKEVCFYISASEKSNSYGITEESFSSRVCTLPMEVITVPNVFTPNSGTVNAFFQPVLSFTPKNYHFVITNRQGKVLFESNDYMAVWDGMQNGTPRPQDVCLWYLKVVTPSGKSISKTGTVTIINK